MCTNILTFFFVFISVMHMYAQDTNYVQYYYADSTISSEGYMKNGKPTGYWKNYYPNGTVKSIGKRTDFKLDSVWNFYTENGQLSQKITYEHGTKNGYEFTYTSTRDTNFLRSKVFYSNNVRQNNALFYDSEGNVLRTVPYKDNIKQGIGYEFSHDSVVKSIIEYSHDTIVSRQNVNRYNEKGEKTGTWVEFYPNGNKKIESNYYKDSLQGVYKMYDIHENIERIGKYNKDSLMFSSKYSYDFTEPKEKITYNDDSTYITFKGQYTHNDIPIGIHRYYSSDGSIDSCVLYDSTGTLLGTGVMKENGNKVGTWTYYYPNGIISAKGNYVSNVKNGTWTYYYPSEAVKQTGVYNSGKETGEWKWYFKSGKLKQVDNYNNGKKNGFTYQYNSSGTRIVEGSFVDGLKNGTWIIRVGDIEQKGTYVYGEKDGTWIHTYVSNGNVRFKGSFFNTKAHGKHIYYYENGSIERIERYDNGIPIKQWHYYDEHSNHVYTRFFKNGKEIQIMYMH
ncbi:MAG: hypothetical protein R6U95_02680 [Bacteroidales bacterium]